MRQSYADFLKASGASEDDVKALDTPAARKAYNAMMDQVDANAAAAAKAKTDLDNYDKWYQDEAIPAYKKMESELTVAQANEAKARSVIKTVQERGLIDVAKDLGYDPEKPTPTPTPTTTPALDPSKYVTTEVLMSVAEREGDAIAVAQDIAFEHSRLFPDKPLNFRELRKEAVSKKVPVEKLWLEKYGVESARAAKAKAEQDALYAKLREEGAAAARAKFADEYGNPNLRPPATSTSPFIPRKEGDRTGKQPWELNENDLASSRLKNATTKVLEKVQ